MKALIFSDTHFGFSKFPEVDELQWRVFDWVKKIIEREGCEMIFFLGDRFVDRDPVGFLRDKVDKKFLELSRMVKEFVCVCGNHDYYLKTLGETNYGLLCEFPNVKVVTEPYVIDVCGTRVVLLPWKSDFTVPEGDICLGHFEVQGTLPWKGECVLPIEHCNKFCLVIVGHLHRWQKFNNGFYIGVPYQRSFSDSTENAAVLIDFSTLGFKLISGLPELFVVWDGSGGVDLVGKIVKVFSRELADKATELGASRVIVEEVCLQDQVKQFEEWFSRIDYVELVREYGKEMNFAQNTIDYGVEKVREVVESGLL